MTQRRLFPGGLVVRIRCLLGSIPGLETKIPREAAAHRGQIKKKITQRNQEKGNTAKEGTNISYESCMSAYLPCISVLSAF